MTIMTLNGAYRALSREVDHMRPAVVSLVVVFLIVSSFAVLAQYATASGEPGPSPAAGTFVGWRDDFNNSANVAASSNVVFTGQEVRLAPPSANLTRTGLVVGHGAPGDFDSYETGAPTVLFDQGMYRMWYHGGAGTPVWSIGYANSTDGIAWAKHGVVVSPSIPTDAADTAYPEVVKVAGGYSMYYSGYDGSNYRILLATSTDGLAWTKQGVVLGLGTPGSFDDLYVYEGSVIDRGGTFYMWYTALSSAGGGPSIGLATSPDGLVWTRQGQVLAQGLRGRSTRSVRRTRRSAWWGPRSRWSTPRSIPGSGPSSPSQCPPMESRGRSSATSSVS